MPELSMRMWSKPPGFRASLPNSTKRSSRSVQPVWKSKFYGAFVPNHRVVLHAIDATPARWRGDAGSSPLDRARTAASLPRNDLVKNCRVHPTHWLISTQRATDAAVGELNHFFFGLNERTLLGD